MPHTARRLAVASIAALTAIVAIIAADSTTTTQAQSDDETAGRIVARRLDDGRVEFGWQPIGGTRILPRQRYFPPDAQLNRWLRSSPIEVDGAAIGRINARLLENGRIEFAFTPTDGERILTRSRYFPADAGVGRWLHSTEITITPAAGYTAVAVAGGHTCAIRVSGEITCWGSSGEGQTDAPAGRFIAITASDGIYVGGDHICAIRAGGEITCWGGLNRKGQIDAPTGNFTAVSAGGLHNCAIRERDGEIECWGDTADSPPAGSYTAVSAGSDHTCAIRETGVLECWGYDRNGVLDAPEGSYTAVSAGLDHTCAIHETGAITCWGSNEVSTQRSGEWVREYAGQATPPAGEFVVVAAGQGYTCAILENDGAIECWGSNGWGQTDAPDGSYTAVAAGLSHACAIRASDSAIECWGDNTGGKATPPAN